MHNHFTQYTFGEIVYLKTDPAQLARIVVGITLKPNSSPYYEIGCGPDSSFHFDIEISATIDVKLKMGIEVDK